MTALKLIYPPHPALTWRPGQLHPMPGYRAQYKYDDWHILVYVLPDGKIRLFSRKKAPLPRYRPPESLIRDLKNLSLPKGHLHILDGGLMHYRTERVKNTIVLWDVLVYEDKYLQGTTYEERYDLLRKICRNPSRPVLLDGVSIASQVTPRLWLAPMLKGDFKHLFERGSKLPEIEGLVLKKMDAPLRLAHQMEGNARWMIRVRKPRIDYAF